MSSWVWPCPGNETITSGVGPRWGTTHQGIDIAAPQGASIVSAKDGVVSAVYKGCTHNYGKDSSCGCGGGYGNYVYVNHQDGTVSRYAHMTSVNVNIGDRVSQGESIGTVGSTGHSTGNHLHFEIRDNDIIKDPELYVNPSNTITSPSSSTSNSDLTDKGFPSSRSDSLASIYNSSVSGDSLDGEVPVMPRDFIEGKAFHAYLKILVGERELIYENGKPSIIQSFEMNRLEDSGNTAQFVIFDDNWDDLEIYLAKNWDNIRMQYGYAGGQLSPIYKMLLRDYSIDFRDEGTILTISAVSQGVIANLNPISLDTGTSNPTEAIKAICEYMEWDIDIDDFAQTKTIEDMEENSGNFILTNDNPITYIKQVIEEYGLTEDGDTVVFYQDSTEGNTVSIKVKSYKEDDDSLDINTYVYMKGYDSVIEDLSFDIKGVFGGTTETLTVTEMTADSFDIYSKLPQSSLQNLETTLTGATGEYSNTRNKQSSVTYTSAGESSGMINTKLSYYIKNASHQAYEATMTILGDPNISILQEIRLINATDYGSPHHTTGIYLVKGIVDTIENGDFRTTLKLIRNGDIKGGIELRAPKYFAGKRRGIT